MGNAVIGDAFRRLVHARVTFGPAGAATLDSAVCSSDRAEWRYIILGGARRLALREPQLLQYCKTLGELWR
jgi:hypothetical protein